ncbi:hybrid sensor histidine kinase/response regulator [Paludibacterium paludis]|uniref:Virulence sensor protein BvgS n=2 Tax=Paludibacterium paludis TaxID=1225769 RepID=A0A918P5I7_9NEIS|nr:hybrid sensor histidine kinase/response regulator [Paludibacterium paludis]
MRDTGLRQRAVQYALAVALPLLAMGVRLSLPVSFGDHPLLILFMFPILLCALQGGARPGIVATAISGMAAAALVALAAVRKGSGVPVHDALQWAMLIVNGAMVSLLSEALHRARRHASGQLEALSRIQGQLQQSEERFQTTFEHAAIGIALVAPDGRWLRVNPHFCQLVGYPQDELLRTTFQAITHPDDVAADEAFVRQMLDGEKHSYTMEKRYRRKDGAIIWVGMTVALVWKDGLPDYFISVVDSISQRKLTEEALRSSTSDLKEAQRVARIGNWRWHLASDQLAWSDEIYRIYERPPDGPPVSYRELRGYHTREGWEKLSGAIEHCRRHGTPYECDVEILREDGSRRWVIARGEADRGDGGEILELHGTVQDITERKLAEQALHTGQATALEAQRQARLAALNLMEDAILAKARAEAINIALSDSEQRSRMAQEDAQAGIWDWEMDTATIHLSAPCSLLYGIEHTGTMSLAAWRERVHPADIGRLDASLAEHLRSRTPFEAEFRIERAGDIRWLAIKGRARFDADGRPRRFTGINQDVTERRRAQEQLKKLSLVVEQSPEGIVVTDVEGRIDYANEAFIRATGFLSEEIIGRNARCLQSGLTPQETYISLKEALERGQRWHGEFINRRKDGEVYHVFSTISPVWEADGTISHFVAVQEDVTEKKRMGEELDRYRYHLEEMVVERTNQLAQAHERAEAANHAKSAFLANMSHEIRTPMNAILGLTHLLKRDGATEAQKERLDKISSSAQHLLGIINDILDLSKIEAGRFELIKEDFSVAGLFAQVGALVADAAQAKGLTIAVDAGGVPPWLLGDVTRLRQALLNYAANAVKFTEEGGIALRARIVRRKGAALLIRFEVEDSGIGVTPEQRDRLFRAFEQADISTSRKYGGTGLGLAITRRLAELMGGEAGCEAATRRGSVFWFTAWLSATGKTGDEPGEPEAGESGLRGRFPGLRILLVEDNNINREVIIELLRDTGLTIDTAGDGQQAIAMAERYRYDLILMDIRLPVLDGLQTTQVLRSWPEWRERPILALSASAFPEDRKACADAGMNDFVAKPVKPEALLQALAKWLPAAVIHPDSASAGQTGAPPSLGDEALVMRLSGLPDIDTRQGLALFNGQSSRYAAFLRRFLADHGDDMAKLEDALASEDRKQAILLAHSLRSAAATLGILRISACATEMEERLSRGALPGDLAHCRTGIDGQFAALRRELDTEASAPTAALAIDMRELRRLFSRLDALLAQNDTAAISLLNGRAAALEAALGSRARRLIRLVQQFRFEAARQYLTALRGEDKPNS